MHGWRSVRSSHAPESCTSRSYEIMTTRSAHHVAEPKHLDHDYGVTPGELIRFEINARGFSQADLAARAGVSAKHLNQVIQDAVPLSADTAIRLERTLGIPAAILTQADAVNQANKQRTRSREKLAEHQEWFKEFPLKVLTAHQIVTTPSAVGNQIEELLKFFGVAERTAYESVYADALQSFRRAQHFKVSPHATSVWLRLAERKADELDVGIYDKAAFAALLRELPSLTVNPIGESFPLLQQRCADVGVAVVYTPSIDGTRASAAVRWLGPTARSSHSLTAENTRTACGLASSTSRAMSSCIRSERASSSLKAATIWTAPKPRRTISRRRPCRGDARRS